MFRCTGSGPGPQARVAEFSESCDSYIRLPEVRDRSNFIDLRFVQNDFAIQIQSWIYKGNGAVTSSVKKIVLGGFLTGLGTGISGSVFMYLVSYDQLVTGPEFAISLVTPLLAVLAVWKKLGVRRRVLLPIAYLTLVMPLFGLGMGGANILQMTLAGALGGIFWACPFVLYTLAKMYL